MFRALGWLAWMAHLTLATLFLGAVGGAAHQEGLRGVFVAAVAVALLPTFVMMFHLDRAGDITDEDRELWRFLLLWGGPVAGAAYLSRRDRRISHSATAQMFRNFFD